MRDASSSGYSLMELMFVVGLIATLYHQHLPFLGLGLAWGIAIATIALVQLAFATGIQARYDVPAALAFLVGPLYPLWYWAISAAAATAGLSPMQCRPRGQAV